MATGNDQNANNQNQNQNREAKSLLESAKTTTQDLYALLGLPSPLTQHATHEDPTTLTDQAIRKAYRRAALVHHPDKNPDNASAAAKFDEINKAYEILIQPEARRAYDERQKALREKAERQKAFEGKRKRMKEDLERRESAGRRRTSGVEAFAESANDSTPVGTPSAKMDSARRWNNGASPGTPKLSEEKEAELRRLAAEGARRRQEQAEKMRRRREQDAASESGDGLGGREDTPGESSGPDTNGSQGVGTSTKRSFNFSTPPAVKKDRSNTSGAGHTAETARGAGKGSSLFQSTMAKLKEAERKRQEYAAVRDAASTATDATS